MNVATSKSYRVVTAELLRRAYLVTTPGDKSRAAELAETGDYGTVADEAIELLEAEDEVCDFSIIEVALEEPPAA